MAILKRLLVAFCMLGAAVLQAQPLPSAAAVRMEVKRGLDKGLLQREHQGYFSFVEGGVEWSLVREPNRPHADGFLEAVYRPGSTSPRTGVTGNGSITVLFNIDGRTYQFQGVTPAERTYPASLLARAEPDPAQGTFTFRGARFQPDELVLVPRGNAEAGAERRVPPGDRAGAADGFEPCVRALGEFLPTGKKLQNKGWDPDHYLDAAGGEWIIKKDNWIEAYASTVFRFFIGRYSQEACFIVEGHKVHSAVRLAKAFQSLGDGPPQYRRALLPPGHGFGPIVACAILLGEIDLKGTASASSNLGMLWGPGGEPTQYFNIDHEQSLRFVVAPVLQTWLDLANLARPEPNLPYLRDIFPGMAITPAHLREIHEAAVAMAGRHRADLVRLLAACEGQLKVLPEYPAEHPGLWSRDPSDNLLKHRPATYQDAVLERFDELRALLGVKEAP
jgi:hypothetical protein